MSLVGTFKSDSGLTIVISSTTNGSLKVVENGYTRYGVLYKNRLFFFTRGSDTAFFVIDPNGNGVMDCNASGGYYKRQPATIQGIDAQDLTFNEQSFHDSLLPFTDMEKASFYAAMFDMKVNSMEEFKQLNPLAVLAMDGQAGQVAKSLVTSLNRATVYAALPNKYAELSGAVWNVTPGTYENTCYLKNQTDGRLARGLRVTNSYNGVAYMFFEFDNGNTFGYLYGVTTNDYDTINLVNGDVFAKVL